MPTWYPIPWRFPLESTYSVKPGLSSPELEKSLTMLIIQNLLFRLVSMALRVLLRSEASFSPHVARVCLSSQPYHYSANMIPKLLVPSSFNGTSIRRPRAALGCGILTSASEAPPGQSSNYPNARPPTSAIDNALPPSWPST